MDKFDEINEKFTILQQQLMELKLEYEGKIKGNAYLKRHLQLVTDLEQLKQKATNLGTHGNIIIIRGKRRRPSRKTPTIHTVETFYLYFTGITEQEAVKVMTLHVNNVLEYTMRSVQTGKVITSKY
jgi:hypothetical protein